MEDYLSEREQIDQVKSWVKDNAPWAIAGLLIGVGLLVGYQQFQAWKIRQSLAANQKYVAELDALARKDKAGATKLADELVVSYRRTPYADFGQLALARFDVEANQLAEAENLLLKVSQSSVDPELKVVSQLRLARVQRAELKFDLALATLAAVPAGAHGALVAHVRGDVLRDKGDKAGAVTAWNEALLAKDLAPADRELLRLKINATRPDVAAAVSPSVTAAPKADTPLNGAPK